MGFFAIESPVPYQIEYNLEGVTYRLDMATGETKAVGSSGFENGVVRAVSPDGEYMATLSVQRDGTSPSRWELGLIDVENRSSIYAGQFHIGYGTLSWSPDSTRLAFAFIPDEGDEELAIVDVITGEFTQLTDNPSHDNSPSWSPDGRKLAFTSSADGYNRLYIYDLAADTTSLVTDKAFGYMPQ